MKWVKILAIIFFATISLHSIASDNFEIESATKTGDLKIFLKGWSQDGGKTLSESNTILLDLLKFFPKSRQRPKAFWGQIERGLVGDVDEGIYSFYGKNYDIFLSFGQNEINSIGPESISYPFPFKECQKLESRSSVLCQEFIESIKLGGLEYMLAKISFLYDKRVDFDLKEFNQNTQMILVLLDHSTQNFSVLTSEKIKVSKK